MLHTMRVSYGRQLSWLCKPLSIGWLLVALLVGCSSSDPNDVLVGAWEGDMSAVGNTIRAVKLKNENPDVAGSDIMRGARAMGQIGANFSEDKTFELVWQGQVKTGTWSFDEVRNEVVLQLNPDPVAAEEPAAADGDVKAEPAPVNGEQANPALDPAKASQWVALLDTSKLQLELFMFDQTTMEYAKNIKGEDGKRLKGLRLKKQ